MRRAYIAVALCLSLGMALGPSATAFTEKSRSLARSVERSSGRRPASSKSCAAATSATAHAQKVGSKPVLLGVRAVGPASAHTRPGIAQAFAFRGRRAGRAQAIRVYIAKGDKARRLTVALYSAGSCAPAARLTSGSSARLKARAWNAVSVRAMTVHAKRTYWLAVMGSGGTLRLRDRSDRKARGCISLTTTNGKKSPPKHWRGGTRHDACALSAYVVGSAETDKGSPTAPTGVPPSKPTGVVPGPPPIKVDYYVGQSSAGIGNGSSCANAESAAWFNTAANWGAGHAIAPGVVVGLCGVISSPLTAQGSGASGSPVTVYWEPGASLSEPYCNGPQSSCFDTNGKSYLTLNGGSNGSIVATANGTGLADQHSSNGIYAEGCAGCTFENLTIANMYVHPDSAAGLADSASASVCNEYCAAIIWNGSNVTVANNTVHDDGWALIDFELSSDANTQIYGNTIYNISHGLALAAVSAGGSIGPVLVHGNTIYGFENWDTTGNSWHHDGIHCYVGSEANGSPPHYNGLYIYNNSIGPGGQSGANFNADIFLEGGSSSGSTPCADSTSPVYVFNNVLSATNDAGCGVNCQYAGNISDYNNTIIGADTTNDQCNVFQDGTGYTVPTSMAFENNATSTCGDEIVARPGSFASGQPTYNVYAHGGNNSFVCGTKFIAFSSFSTWQSCISGDAHSSTTANAMLNSNGSPQSGSPTTGAGANLTSLCTGYLVPLCSTINGTARPTSGAWNTGAY